MSDRAARGRRGSRALRRVGRGLLSASPVQWLLAGLGAAYLWLAFRTTRWRRVGDDNLQSALAAPHLLVSVWHGRLAPIVLLRPRGRRAVGLISEARDGEIIARIVRLLGGETVRGSSRDPKKPDADKGGAAASAAMSTALRAGAIGVMTPDGPRGPRMRAKPGVAALSAATGAVVLPVAFSVRRGAEFSSWDRFLLPWPATRGVVVYGAPIAPPDRATPDALEAHRAAIEAATTQALRAADDAIGRRSPEPDAPGRAAAANLALREAAE